MDKDILIPLVEMIHGCTFATLDALTEPKKGIACRVTGRRVIIFRTKGGSGWEGMVKRKLAEAGKDADSFNVGRLLWGERLGNLPIIEHNGKFYLQTIELDAGKVVYYIPATGQEVNPKDFGIRPNRGFEGLPSDDTVRMNTYNLDSITRITLMGKTVGVTANKETRAILSIKFGK